MADVRVRGAVSAKSSKKRHKMVVTDDKVRVGRTAESGSGDGDEDEDDDFDDADDVDGDFDDADNADVEAAGAAGAADTGAAPAVTGAEASTNAEAVVTADASDADADEPTDEPADEPTQEGATPMAEQTTPSAIVRPLHDRILVKRLDAEQKTPGGLFIPDNAKEKPVEGLVVAVGNGVLTKDGTRVPLDVKAGDRVLFSKYSGNEVKIALDGGEHLILREDDILAVLEIP